MSHAATVAIGQAKADGPIDYDPFGEHVLLDPFPYYRRLRREAPVYFAERSGMFCLARYDDAVAVLRNPGLFSSDAVRTVTNGARPAIDLRSKLRLVAQIVPLFLRSPRVARVMASRNMLSLDPPEHTAMRNIVNRGFTPRRVGAWEPRIREISEELAAALRRKGSFDLIEDFAGPLPVIVISEMLGVDPERRDEFRHWSDALVAGLMGPRSTLGLARSGAFEAMGWLAGHMREVVRERQSRPRDDLISVLVRAQAGDGALGEAEALFFAVGLLVAGNETTTRLIAAMVHALLLHPDQREQVAHERRLVVGAVEETLRLAGPVQLTLRRAREAAEIAGVPIPRNSLVAVLLASANRDEGRWGEDAEAFHVTREVGVHLAFGLGAHFCLGAGLARLEGRIALETLLEDLPRWQPEGPPEIEPTFIARGIRRLRLGVRS